MQEDSKEWEATNLEHMHMLTGERNPLTPEQLEELHNLVAELSLHMNRLSVRLMTAGHMLDGAILSIASILAASLTDTAARGAVLASEHDLRATIAAWCTVERSKLAKGN